jgi:putative endonuclease
MKDTAQIGRAGEDLAVKFLEGKGAQIIARNFRSRAGEVDIIAIDGETLVFVEVKSWSAFGLEDLERSITAQKRFKIIETAKYFLLSNRKYSNRPIRFDVLFLGEPEIEHLISAFVE